MNEALPVKNGTYFFSSFVMSYTKIMEPFCTFMVLKFCVYQNKHAFVVARLIAHVWTVCIMQTPLFCVRAWISVQLTDVVIDWGYKIYRASTS